MKIYLRQFFCKTLHFFFRFGRESLYLLFKFGNFIGKFYYFIFVILLYVAKGFVCILQFFVELFYVFFTFDPFIKASKRKHKETDYQSPHCIFGHIKEPSLFISREFKNKITLLH